MSAHREGTIPSPAPAAARLHSRSPGGAPAERSLAYEPWALAGAVRSLYGVDMVLIVETAPPMDETPYPQPAPSPQAAVPRPSMLARARIVDSVVLVFLGGIIVLLQHRLICGVDIRLEGRSRPYLRCRLL